MRQLLLVFCSFGLVAAAPLPPTKQLIRKPYAVARPQLVKMGFTPVPWRRKENEYFCDDDFCKQYPEVMYCTGTGINECEYLFKRNSDGKYWVAFTYGEEGFIVSQIRPAKGEEFNGLD